MPRTRIVISIGLAVSCLSASGCIAKTQDGDATVYHFEWWTWTACLAVGVALVGLGWMLRTRSFFKGWMMIIVGCLFGLAIAPGLAVESLIVDAEHFEIRRAPWFWSYNLRFDDIRSIDLTSKQRWTKRGKRIDYNLVCIFRNGEREFVPVGDLLSEALAEVFDQAKAKNIAVTDRTGK